MARMKAKKEVRSFPPGAGRNSTGRFIALKQLGLLWMCILAMAQFSSRGAAAMDEPQLIHVLESNASLQEKDAACTQLKRIGTEHCVPALAALLTDEQLSHSARYALEPMQSPKAGAALIHALELTSGLVRVGIINSLAVRREVRAVPALEKLLKTQGSKNADNDSILAAANALGEIATPGTVKTLERARSRSSGLLHAAIVDALLRSANHQISSGEQSRAEALFNRIYSAETNVHVRIAAYSGLLRSSGKPAELFTEALLGPPGPKQTAALLLIRNANFPNAGDTFADLLPKTAPPVQIALIEGLRQRADSSAAPTIALLARNSDSPVKTAALGVLGQLGDSSMVSLLAEAAAFGREEEKTLARRALVELRRGNPNGELLAQLPKSKPEIQVELARALGQRGNTSAVPALVKLAGEDSGAGRKAALQALASLAREQDLPSLIELVISAPTEAARSEAADALSETLHRMLARNRRVEVTPLVAAMESSQPDQRIALLTVCSVLSDARIRELLRKDVSDPHPGIRTAAVRALCDSRDIELLPDAVRIALYASEENFRALATAASVRLISQDEGAKLPNDIRLTPLKAFLDATPSVAQKKMILAGLAEIRNAEALALAEPLLSDAQVQNEAASAVLKIAPTLAEADHSIAAVKRVHAVSTDPATRSSAESVLKQLEARAK